MSKENKGRKSWIDRLFDMRGTTVVFTKESFNNKGNGNQDFKSASVLSDACSKNNQTSSEIDRNNVIESPKRNQIIPSLARTSVLPIWEHMEKKPIGRYHAPPQPVIATTPPRPNRPVHSAKAKVDDSDEEESDDEESYDEESDYEDSDEEESDDEDLYYKDLDADEDMYVNVFLEKVYGRKTITIIQGINDMFNHLKILRNLREQFGCNGRVILDRDLGKVIELAGDQRRIVAHFLVAVDIVKKKHLRIHDCFDF